MNYVFVLFLLCSVGVLAQCPANHTANVVNQTWTCTAFIPCAGGGCSDVGACIGGICYCPPTRRGALCELVNVDCNLSPCRNNGTCLFSVCVCLPGTSGTYCESVDGSGWGWTLPSVEWQYIVFVAIGLLVAMTMLAIRQWCRRARKVVQDAATQVQTEIEQQGPVHHGVSIPLPQLAAEAKREH